jgi:hypothetical protein
MRVHECRVGLTFGGGVRIGRVERGGVSLEDLGGGGEQLGEFRRYDGVRGEAFAASGLVVAGGGHRRATV